MSNFEWPDNFVKFFHLLEMFYLNFEFGGALLGVWTTIWTWLLVPPWPI